MARTKVTPRRRELRLPLWMLRQNKTYQRNKRTYPYKIKLTLPEQKQVDIIKNGAIIKTIRVNRNISIPEVREYNTFLNLFQFFHFHFHFREFLIIYVSRKSEIKNFN